MGAGVKPSSKQFLAEDEPRSDRIVSSGRKPSYTPFMRILAGELYEPGTYQYNEDLKIRCRSHVLPGTHKLFGIVTARELVCYELHGPCPLVRLDCCGRLVALVPSGGTTAELCYRLSGSVFRHWASCLDRQIRERPLGYRRPRKVPKRDDKLTGWADTVGRDHALRRHSRDSDKPRFATGPEVVPLLGRNLSREELRWGH